MATTTTNYGFDIPQSTDLVKDGATAIATLGQDIDTAMNTALGTKKAGMVLLNTTSFSGVSSQSVNDVFSATYDQYRIVCNFQINTTANLLMRLRVSGADNTSANYSWARHLLISDAATPSVNPAGSNGLTADGFRISQATNSGENNFSVEVFNPFVSAKTNFTSLSAFHQTSTNSVLYVAAGGMSVTTSYTGFTIYQSTGTNGLSGTVRVYGYNN